MATYHLVFAQEQEFENQISPGTAVARIEWLSISENQLICDLEKPLVSEVVILEVLKVGSGLVSPPYKGDTLKVEVRKLGDCLPTINHQEEYVLRENPCLLANESYYSIFFKKD